MIYFRKVPTLRLCARVQNGVKCFFYMDREKINFEVILTITLANMIFSFYLHKH